MDWENWRGILRCPICLTELVYNPASFACEACGKTFPIHFGIPDFRLFPPDALGYMSEEEDLRVSAELFDLHEKRSFEELIRIKISREGDHLGHDLQLQDLYIKWRLDNHDRALKLSQWAKDQGISFPYCADDTLGLDIGCGSGSGMATILEVADTAIGFDLTISDLILAKSYLKEFYPGRDYLLFAGVAEHLPLASEVFSLVLARDVIEHVGNQKQFIQEGHRVMRSGTYFLFNTGSRFTLVEPHTQLPGVGYLPRFLQPIYVRLLQRGIYRVHLPSLWELRRWLNESPFTDNWKIFPSKQIDEAHKWRTRVGKVAHLLLRPLRYLGILRWINRLLSYISSYEVVLKK